MSTAALVADHEPASRQMLITSLSQWGYDVVAVSEGVEALRLLCEEHAPRLAILDWMLPELNGLQVTTNLRKLRPRPYTYILLLTPKGRKKDILQALEVGADDCLLKPFDAEELKTRLHVGQRTLDLHNRLLSALDTAEFRGTHDPITGVYNRSTILEVLRREVVRSRREDTSLVLLVIDVDHFKLINDTFGPLVGDEALKLLALRIKSVLRCYDWFGRSGGEEFMIVAPNCKAQDGVSIAERIRSSIATDDLLIGNASIRATVSVGVVAGQGQTDDTDLWLAAANSALDRAKALGCNRVETIERAKAIGAGGE